MSVIGRFKASFVKFQHDNVLSAGEFPNGHFFVVNVHARSFGKANQAFKNHNPEEMISNELLKMV